MSRWIHGRLYSLAWWASYHRWDWLCALIYRYRCPYPISPRHFSTRRCFELGDCGCDNAERFKRR